MPDVKLAASEFLIRRYERLLEVVEAKANPQDWSDWNFEARYGDAADYDEMWQERLDKKQATEDEARRISLTFPCPKCSRPTGFALSVVETSDRVTCPHCGQVIKDRYGSVDDSPRLDLTKPVTRGPCLPKPKHEVHEPGCLSERERGSPCDCDTHFE